MVGINKVQRLFHFFQLLEREFNNKEFPKKKFILLLKAHIGSDKRTLRDYLGLINEFDFLEEDEQNQTIKVNKENVDLYRRFSRNDGPEARTIGKRQATDNRDSK